MVLSDTITEVAYGQFFFFVSRTTTHGPVKANGAQYLSCTAPKCPPHCAKASYPFAHTQAYYVQRSSFPTIGATFAAE